jgi:hypothetical protein
MALVGQKIKSLTGFDRWWYSVLQTGEMGANRYVLLCEEDTLELSPTSENFISTSVLVNCYQDFAKAHGLTGKSIDSRGLKDRLDVLCPLAQYHRAEKTGKQKRGYRIPSLPVARSEFETFIGGALEWPL